MCFSAGASFGASAILGAAGAASLYMAKKPRQKFFAAIPLIFAIQQFTEGFVWLSTTHAEFSWIHNYAMYSFLVFAQVVWPVWEPLSVYLMERGPKQRIFLNIILGMGISEALYMAYGLVFLHVTGEVECQHVRYVIGFPDALMWPSIILYGSATVLAPFISGIRWMRLLGVALAASYLISDFLFEYFITSVWCYFAAALSVIVLLIVWEMNKGKKKVPEVAI